MGMYNEVFKKCPNCGKTGYMQIPQIVLGFGGFNLDDRTTLERYSLDQLHELHIAVRGKTFHCGGYSPSTIPENNPHDGCGHHFTFLEATGKKDERTAMLREFFDL